MSIELMSEGLEQSGYLANCSPACQPDFECTPWDAEEWCGPSEND